MSGRAVFSLVALLLLATSALLTALFPWGGWTFLGSGAFVLLGAYDIVQRAHTIRRNFPVLGRMRYLLEDLGPPIRQYFIENNNSGRPFSRALRSVVYQRAKGVVDTIPFGTERDVYAVGYEWINHSIDAKHPQQEPFRVRIGGPDCTQPYDAALLNVSAMSFGSLSRQAVEALNRGAAAGGFAHNTGEGSISPYHLQGGDLIWQIGTGYFGCRDDEGRFDPDRFAEKAKLPAVKMIEIKLSQGAKPGHGGILPAKKVSLEIADIRGVPLGQDVLSPPSHSAFDSPKGLMFFIAQLRRLSEGKPIGIKLCVGKRREVLALVKAMLETQILPDFIVVDGAEGGTGAAPFEFSNIIGTPLVEGLIFVHNALVGTNLRDRVKIIASGRVITGFDIVKKLAVGADLCYSARAMMFALGCIQALECNSNRCPTGIATQREDLARGIDVEDKAARVARYQAGTVKAAMEIMAASGCDEPDQIREWHINRRVSPTRVLHYGEIYSYLKGGELLGDDVPKQYAHPWHSAQVDSFEPNPDERISLYPVVSAYNSIVPPPP